ncbi:MAG: 50S ribosomal protein L21 [SAR202 cluster bacterium]|jgi:large subunit ribosomal protein L21|nr:MAG: 50S ribosomal protein L21 [SAR202 cluster bacterium]
MDYAVFKTGGKQYRVKPGDTLDVEKLSVAVDSIAEFGEVLAISDNGEVTFGSPMIEGARVLARVDSHYKDKKLMVFKYKSKTRYRRKKGHRQTYTRLVIQDIQSEPPAPPRRRRARASAAVAEEGSTENGS